MDKKLYKRKDQAKFLGVCAGIADYFNVDVTLVRLVTFLAILAWGTGIIAYFGLAIIMPDITEIKPENEQPQNRTSSKSIFDE